MNDRICSAHEPMIILMPTGAQVVALCRKVCLAVMRQYKEFVE